MKVAFGHLHYTPDEFWSFSLREWQACYKGHHEFHQGEEQDDIPFVDSDLQEMMERYPDDGTG